MKTSSTTNSKGLLLSLGLGLLSFTGFSQEHITLSVENITAKSTTIEYDLFIVNDGTTALKLAGCAYGINYNGTILNGGNPSEASFAYAEGTRSRGVSGLTDFSVLNTNREGVNQLRVTTKPSKKEDATVLPINVPYKVGHFVFTNSKAWTSNSNPILSLREFTVPGQTVSCALAYVNSDQTYTGFSVAKKNLSVKVVTSPILNPSTATEATLNGATKMQTATTQDITKQGLNDLQDNKISMYPNPTQDIVNIDLYAASIINTIVKVSDIRGRVVKQIQARSEKGYNQMTVSLREVPSGVYTVQVFQDNKLSFTDQVTKKD